MKKSSRRIASALLSMAVAAASLPMNALGMPMIRLASDENIPGGVMRLKWSQKRRLST